MTEDVSTIGQRIRLARTRRGVTQEELAKLVGKSKQLISAWEGNRSELLSSSLASLARALFVDVGWLLYGGQPEFRLIGSPRGKIVPLLGASVLERPTYPALDHHSRTQYAYVHHSISNRGFATEVPDSGMQGIVEKGDLIAVDPDLEIETSMLVLAAVRRDSGKSLERAVLLCRQIRCLGIRCSKDEFDLIATSPGFPTVRIRGAGDGTLLGAIVGVSRSLLKPPKRGTRSLTDRS